MDWKDTYKRWADFPTLDIELENEIDKLVNNEKALEDAFYKDLEFGTGGMRGVIGAGTNRMNIYTVRKASLGLAKYVMNRRNNGNGSIAIAYDCRHKSQEFALEVAKTVGKFGIKAYLFDSLNPTPVLSFAVRFLGADAGVVITASHNPPEYNGFKVYGSDGGQLPLEGSEELIKYVNQTENELSIEVEDEAYLVETGLIDYIGKDVVSAYLKQLKNIQIKNWSNDELKIVYTPLHGTGNIPVQRGLESFGFTDVLVVKEQELPDPNFSTVSSPNPEEHAAFELAIKYGQEKGADILMGTDPDADRLGVAAKNEKGEYQVLTGNQMGALMLHYLLSQKKTQGMLADNGVVLKTIVTSEIGRVIAEDYNMKTLDTLTGFKFIGEKINEFEQTGNSTFLFGYEESYGYLIGDFVRDKDAVQSAVFAAEVAAYYKKKGMTLFQGLEEIFAQYGYFQESLRSLTLKGIKGTEQVNEILEGFRSGHPVEIGGIKVIAVEDYRTRIRTDLRTLVNSEIQLPQSNVLKYFLEDDSWFCIRPSGTEPKCKFYFGVRGTSLEDSQQKLKKLETEVMQMVERYT